MAASTSALPYGAARGGRSVASTKQISDSTSRCVNTAGSNRHGACWMPALGMGAQVIGPSGAGEPTFQPPMSPNSAITRACTR